MNELILLAINEQAPSALGGIGGLAPILIMFVIFYFLLIRPQRKRMKEHEEMIARLKKGDRVVTSGGLIGSIHALTDSELTLDLDGKTKVRVIRTQVNLYAPAAAAGDEQTGEKGK